MALILKESEETSFHEGYDPNTDNEDWLNGYSAKIQIGGVSAVVTMTEESGNLLLRMISKPAEIWFWEKMEMDMKYKSLRIRCYLPGRNTAKLQGNAASILALEKVIKFDAS